jgi:hypothetical protein
MHWYFDRMILLMWLHINPLHWMGVTSFADLGVFFRSNADASVSSHSGSPGWMAQALIQMFVSTSMCMTGLAKKTGALSQNLGVGTGFAVLFCAGRGAERAPPRFTYPALQTVKDRTP